jgi:intracellular sulfur oxidation DsrE/DsrF family protein
MRSIHAWFKGVLLLFCLCSYAVQADEKYNDAAALNGISAAKAVFLIDFKSAKTTAFYMDLIVGTYDGLKRQGVDPEMVVVVIGPTVKFLSKESDPELTFDYEQEFDSIQTSISELNQRGVRIEVCAIATDVFKVDNSLLPSALSVVADGFISLIGWQMQGYKLVPVFS